MEEVGIYRVSGVATDIQALKTAFDTSEFRRPPRLIQASAEMIRCHGGSIDDVTTCCLLQIIKTCP